MTRRELKEQLVTCLSPVSGEDAPFEAEQIIRQFAGAKLTSARISEDAVLKCTAAAERRLDREPLQYILGEWEFYGLPFKVGKGVLIPRPDTETVTCCALKLISTMGRGRHTVYDLCAGSGCIGISIAKHTDISLFPVEKSNEAVGFLKENLLINGVDAPVTVGDVLDGSIVPENAADIIVCNPPYIESGVLPTLEPELMFEPKTALDGGDDGLFFYRSITPLWKPALKPGGYIVYEIGFDQAESVKDILEKNGFCDIITVKDAGKITRVVYGRKSV